MLTVLVATTNRWISNARLVIALKNAGCTVDVICPSGHPLRVTSALRRAYPYHGLRPLASFMRAIVTTKPDLVLPGDDLAARHLHKLYFREQSKTNGDASLCALIERSLGSSDSFPTVNSRAAFLQLASEEGIRIPKTKVLGNVEDLEQWLRQMGLPTVLKANGTTGGEGVRIVQSTEEAKRALRAMQAPPLLVRTAKRALLNHDTTLIWPTLLRRRSVVNAQEFVSGREATSLVACWKGAVLAGLHFEVLTKQGATGPATVMRVIENFEMTSAAGKMVRRLNLSGLHGFDFMLEAQTGNAYLIEINPRTTQVAHLTFGPGRDLPAALCAAVSGAEIKESLRITEKDTITLFPNEWRRNPASTFLKTGYHDVPWEEPELIRACMGRRRDWTKWYAEQKKRIQALGVDLLPRL